MLENQIERQFLSPRGLAKATGLSLASVYRGIENKEIPASRVGSRLLISQKWLTSLEAGESDE